MLTYFTLITLVYSSFEVENVSVLFISLLVLMATSLNVDLLIIFTLDTIREALKLIFSVLVHSFLNFN